MCLLFLGLVANHPVHQSPPHMLKNHGESAELRCSHLNTDFDHILWFKQTEDDNLIYFGYLNLKHPYPENIYKDKIQLDRDGSSAGTLTIKNLMVNDSSVYFCAARRHSI